MWLAWLGKTRPATNARSGSPQRCGRTSGAARPRPGKAPASPRIAHGRKSADLQLTDPANLEALAESGDAEAQFALGSTILADPNGGDWRRAAALIDAAADAGHAGAAERCAVFECMGVGRPQDWDKCLDRLEQAAEQGSASAAGQLLVLADDRIEEEPPARPPAGSWRGVRERIALAEKLRAAAPKVLLPRPMILTIADVASIAECRWVIGAASRRLEPAYVHDTRTGRSGVDPNRTNLGATFPVFETDVVLEMIRQRIAGAMHIPLPNFEVPQVLRYLAGQEFKPHFDFLDPESDTFRAEVARNGQRAATVLVYLNEDFEGGETQFPKLGVSYRGRPGDALVFANVDPAGNPDRATLHAGLPPTSGEKWLLSQWVRDRPLGSGG